MRLNTASTAWLMQPEAGKVYVVNEDLTLGYVDLTIAPEDINDYLNLPPDFSVSLHVSTLSQATINGIGIKLVPRQ